MSLSLVGSSKQWLIVEMEDEGDRSSEIVPKSWHNNLTSECYWPPKKNPAPMVTRCEHPSNSWPRYKSRVLGEYSDYRKARDALRKSEYTSDLATDGENDLPYSGKRRTRAQLKPEPVPKRLNFNDEFDDEGPQQTSAGANLLSNPPPPPCVASDVQEGADVAALLNSFKSVIPGNEPAVPGVNELSSGGSAIFPQKQPQADWLFGARYQNSPSFSDRSCVSRGSMEDHRSPNHSGSASDHHFNNLTGSADAPNDKVPHSATPSTSRCVENANDGLLRKLVNDVGLLKQYVLNMDRKIDSLRKQQNNSSAKIDSIIQLPIPIKSMEEFQKFECSLEEATRGTLSDTIILSGGDTVVELVGRAMKKIFTDEVASKFSLKGQKGNENFSSTNIWAVLKCAILSVQSLQPTEKKIEKAVSEWFRHANGRLKDKLEKGRKRENI